MRQGTERGREASAGQTRPAPVIHNKRRRPVAVVNQEQIWSVVQEELRFQLAKPSYETWLKNTSLISADGNTFRIAVPSKLAKDWLEDRFAGLIQETLQAVTGGEVEVDFVVAALREPVVEEANGSYAPISEVP